MSEAHGVLAEWQRAKGVFEDLQDPRDASGWTWLCPRPLLVKANGAFGAPANVDARDALLCADLEEFGLDCGAAANYRVAGEMCARLEATALRSALNDPLVAKHTCGVVEEDQHSQRQRQRRRQRLPLQTAA